MEQSPNPTTETKPLDLSVVSALMNLAEVNEQTKQDIQSQVLDHQTQREAYRKRLREYYDREGTPMSQESIDRAVDAYLEDQTKFQEPPKGLDWILARIYIRRLRLTVTFAACVVAVTVCSIAHNAWYESNQQRAFDAAQAPVITAEHDLKEAQTKFARVQATTKQALEIEDAENRAGIIPAFAKGAQQTLRTEIQSSIQAAEAILTQAQEAVGKAQAATKIVRDKPWRVHSPTEWEALTKSAVTTIAVCDWPLIKPQLDTIDQALKKQNVLDTTAKQWQSLQSSIVACTDNSTLAQIASHNTNAKTAIETGNPADAQNEFTGIQKLLQDWQKWNTVQQTLTTAIEEAQQCPAKDTVTQAALQATISQAKQALSERDTTKAQSAKTQIKDLVQKINQHYTIQIVCRIGQKTAVTRRSQQTGGTLCYMIVEALDESGKQVKISVKNRENGYTAWTPIWGEEISQDLYNQIAAEKRKTGVVSDLSFGQKEAGFLEPKYTRIAASTHRITSW